MESGWNSRRLGSQNVSAVLYDTVDALGVCACHGHLIDVKVIQTTTSDGRCLVAHLEVLEHVCDVGSDDHLDMSVAEHSTAQHSSEVVRPLSEHDIDYLRL